MRDSYSHTDPASVMDAQDAVLGMAPIFLLLHDIRNSVYNVKDWLARIPIEALTALKVDFPIAAAALSFIEQDVVRLEDLVAVDEWLVPRFLIPCDVNELVLSVIDALGSMTATNHESIMVRTALASGLPMVTGHPSLKRVFMELFQNSLKAKASELSVSSWLSDANREVVLAVADNGTGVPLELGKGVFSLYMTTREIDRPTAKRGLGLHLCDIYLQALGGRIELDRSIPEEETVFLVFLPVHNIPGDNRPGAVGSVRRST